MVSKRVAVVLGLLSTHLQIVGVLPHVDAEDGDLAAHNRVLVLGRHNAQTLRVLDQPAPATALKPQQCLCHGILKALQGAPCLGDLGHQGRCAIRLCVSRASRCQILPEEGVVDVTSAVELDGTLQGNLTGDVVRRGGRGVGLKSVVQVGDIGLVVLAMVKLHDLSRDAGLQGLRRTESVRRVFFCRGDLSRSSSRREWGGLTLYA